MNFASDLELTDELKFFFGAQRGAGSIISAGDEGKKAQITVTKQFERPIMESLVSHIPMGKKDDLGDECLKSFRIFPSGYEVRLPLLYRPDYDGRDELRLYMRAGSFRPLTDMYWFIFEREGGPWLATLTKDELSAIHGHVPFDSQNGFDQALEEQFQIGINSNVPTPVSTVTNTYRRDARVAQAALLKAQYQCEIRPDLETFASKATGKPYLEAHHLLPMMEQRHFSDCSIDVVENVCILNPYAHRMLHHAKYSDIEAYLKKLVDPREQFFSDLGVSVDRVLECYKG